MAFTAHIYINNYWQIYMNIYYKYIQLWSNMCMYKHLNVCVSSVVNTKSSRVKVKVTFCPKPDTTKNKHPQPALMFFLDGIRTILLSFVFQVPLVEWYSRVATTFCLVSQPDWRKLSGFCSCSRFSFGFCCVSVWFKLNA